MTVSIAPWASARNRHRGAGRRSRRLQRGRRRPAVPEHELVLPDHVQRRTDRPGVLPRCEQRRQYWAGRCDITINYNNSLSKIAQKNGLTSIPLPPPNPPFPFIDPSGGGIKGNGAYIDVDGDGRLTNSDQLFIINYLNSDETFRSAAKAKEKDSRSHRPQRFRVALVNTSPKRKRRMEPPRSFRPCSWRRRAS